MEQGDQNEAVKTFERIRSFPGFAWSKEAILIRNLIHGRSGNGRLKAFSFIRSLYGHQDSVDSLCPSPDGLRLLTGSRDGYAAMWDVVTGRRLLRLQVGYPVKKVFFLTKQDAIFTWSTDKVGSNVES